MFVRKKKFDEFANELIDVVESIYVHHKTRIEELAGHMENLENLVHSKAGKAELANEVSRVLACIEEAKHEDSLMQRLNVKTTKKGSGGVNSAENYVNGEDEKW